MTREYHPIQATSATDVVPERIEVGEGWYAKSVLGKWKLIRPDGEVMWTREDFQYFADAMQQAKPQGGDNTLPSADSLRMEALVNLFWEVKDHLIEDDLNNNNPNHQWDYRPSQDLVDAVHKVERLIAAPSAALANNQTGE